MPSKKNIEEPFPHFCVWPHFTSLFSRGLREKPLFQSEQRRSERPKHCASRSISTNCNGRIPTPSSCIGICSHRFFIVGICVAVAVASAVVVNLARIDGDHLRAVRPAPNGPEPGCTGCVGRSAGVRCKSRGGGSCGVGNSAGGQWWGDDLGGRRMMSRLRVWLCNLLPFLGDGRSGRRAAWLLA